MSGLLVWIFDNPLVSGLTAVIVALGLYAGVQHFRITHLESVNATLEANEAIREQQAKEALRKNELTEAANAAKTKRVQNDAIKIQKTADSLYADNQRLLAELRSGPDSCSMSQAAGSAASHPNASPGDNLPRDCPSILVEIAKSADYLRSQVLACQAFVK
jgi:hypothetical protein